MEEQTELGVVEVGVQLVLAGADLVGNVGKTCDRALQTRKRRLYSAAWLGAQTTRQLWAYRQDPLYRALRTRYENLNAAEQVEAVERGETEYFSAVEAGAPWSMFDLLCAAVKALPVGAPGAITRWGADGVSRALRGYSTDDIASLELL